MNEYRPDPDTSVEQAGEKSSPWKRSLARVAMGGAIVGALVLILWQAGILFQSKGGAVGVDTTGFGQTIEVRNADVSLDTPNAHGLTVGTDKGDLAPDFEVTDLTGKRVRLSDFRGHPVFINFWATWCGPCKLEMPDLQKVLDSHKGDGLVVVAVDYGETYARANAYVKSLGLRLTAVGLDPTTEVARRYSVQGLPMSFVVNSDGVITHVFTGQTSGGTMDFAVRDSVQPSTGQ